MATTCDGFRVGGGDPSSFSSSRKFFRVVPTMSRRFLFVCVTTKVVLHLKHFALFPSRSSGTEYDCEHDGQENCIMIVFSYLTKYRCAFGSHCSSQVLTYSAAAGCSTASPRCFPAHPNFDWQCRHFTASGLTFSLQYGHFTSPSFMAMATSQPSGPRKNPRAAPGPGRPLARPIA